MAIVPRFVTSPTKDEFLKAFTSEWHYSEGSPSPLAAWILFAQFAFETGWGKYCYDWNLGNVRKGSWPGDVFELPTAWEMVNGKRVVVGGQFRAFHSLQEGMFEHLCFLETLPRYAKAFEVLVEASVTACDKSAVILLAKEFVHALKEGGYFTGNEEDYTKGVTNIALSCIEPVIPYFPHLLGSDPEFNGWGATKVEDVFGRWQYDEHMTADFLACRYDCGGDDNA